MDNFVVATRPPLLDEKNYFFWKVQVNAYIKAIDEHSWHSVVIKWISPNITTDEVTIVKSKEENSLAITNFKTLNVIFASINATQFKLISTCKCAKDAWKILQNAYEGTTLVKISKLQMLASRFEDLRMLSVISTPSCAT